MSKRRPSADAPLHGLAPRDEHTHHGRMSAAAITGGLTAMLALAYYWALYLSR
ncbi:hypothetical protein KQH60_11885 [Mycetohabitans sp. B8]|uniref:hypothetical protein n=1 Tax=Mycetohabitans sp. B8 TaxID=2841845 RepID=UPI001F20B0B9|nr:hypothetical protein [Mycetohabitans sp. B8]MCG1043197.1 hypothetical protein [Mycetohabitans sp. B8]